MAEYEGGIGGKFRKRPFRRAAATPYDRPPAALRGSMAVHVAGSTAEGGGGWLSKLVDPASRLIATGASRIFSSVFRKRLPALPPPPIPEGNRQSRHVPELACTVPSSELQEEEKGRDNQRSNSDNDGIAELEQLLKQKTFTRVEFDRLAELLRSRTVEPYKGENENSGKQLQQQQQQCLSNAKKESTNVTAQADRIGSLKVHESLVVHSDSLTILQDQAASPAELAKAYMGMRPAKASSSASGLRNQFYREEKGLPSIPSASKPLDLSVTPRSAIRFSGIPEHPENGYQTPRPLGRSAIYRMSRSPYFKVNPTTNVKGGERNGDGYTYTSSSQWTPRSAMQSGGKQVLKRGSSVLDGDFGSVGPIRRIRQKYNLNSPPKDARSSLSGSPLSSPLALPFKEFPEGSTSVQEPLLLGKPMHGSTGSLNAGNRISNASVAPVPTRSSETAHKLFQQLDRLLPSPIERSSEMKTITREESPSKLTLGMLHGRALKSMEEIDSSKFSSRQGSGRLSTSDSHLPTSGSFFSGKMDVVEENGHPKSDILGVKLTSETNEVKTASTPSTSNPGRIFANSAVPPQSKKPSFQMSAPEDSLDLDDDEYPKNLASPLITGKNGAESRIPESQNATPETAISEPELKMPKKDNIVSAKASSESKSKVTNYKEVIFGTATSERSLMTSSESIAVSSSISSMEADKKASIQPVISGKGTGFPIASDPSSQSQQHLTPTMPTLSLNQSTLQKEQTSPVFNFGSKAAGTLAFSSTTLGVNDTAGVKLDAGSVSDLKSSNSHATITPAEGSNLIKGGETQKSGDLFKSFGSTVSSSMSTTPAIFSFGASTSPSLSNGTLGSSSSTFPVPATPAIKLSETPTNSIFPTSTATTSNSTTSISSAASLPSFQFGSGTSSSTAVPTSLDKPKSSVVVTEPANASPFNISNSTTLGESMFSNTGSSSSSTTTFAFSGSGSAPSALMTSGISTNESNSSSMPSSSSLFSSMGVSSSSLAPSSSFPSTGSGVFGFSGSSQSSSSSMSFANSNSQNSTTAFGGTGGSIFGTRSNLPGDGISQSSTSNVASFSSSPAFGLSNSSSSTFSVMPLRSTTSGAKPFTPTSGFSISPGSGPSSASTSSSFMPAAASGMFSSSSQASTSSIFGSTSTSSTSPSTGFSFGLSAPGSGSSTSLSSTSSSSGFSFGLSPPGSGSSPFTFGSSSSSVFSFNSSAPTTSSIHSSAQPAFGLPNPALGFNSGASGLPGNDQMNVEDSMTDDTNQAPSFPTFGQPANQPATPSFVFGSQGVQPGAPFQFGSHPSGPQNPSPFQPTGNLELPQGGSFSLGSGGGDKSGRKIVKPNRNKYRKK